MTTVRRYRPTDAPAVQSLHERVIRAAGTDPADLPNTDDVTDIEGSTSTPAVSSSSPSVTAGWSG